MADKSYIVVVLRKEVADKQEAETLYEAVKTRLTDRPDINVKATYTNHFDFPEG